MVTYLFGGGGVVGWGEGEKVDAEGGEGVDGAKRLGRGRIQSIGNYYKLP